MLGKMKILHDFTKLEEIQKVPNFFLKNLINIYGDLAKIKEIIHAMHYKQKNKEHETRKTYLFISF